MNAFVKKEARMLAPGVAAALALASLVLLIQLSPWSTSEFRTLLEAVLLILFPVLAGMLALVPFAGEVSAGTLSNLLSQPISRARVWWIKASSSAASLGVAFGAWWLCYLAGVRGPGNEGDSGSFFATSFFWMCAVYSGGLWSVLLLRQVAVAFWCTVLVPVALLLATFEALKHRPEWHYPAGAVLLAIYSIAGFLWARWMFLRAQDVPWTGGAVSFPRLFGSSKSHDRRTSARRRSPQFALLFKELQLHQTQVVVAGVLLLTHLAVLASRSLAGSEAAPTMEFVYAHFWVVWLAMPLVVGSAALAEERNLGTMHSELCLPASRFTILSTKLTVVLGLSVLLGVGMPVLLEGPRILWDNLSAAPALPTPRFLGLGGGGGGADLIWKTWRAVTPFLSEWQPVLAMIALAAGLGFISFCASSLCRTTLQALAGAVLGVAVSVMALSVAAEARSNSGMLIFLIGAPVLTLTIGRLLYWNSKVLDVGRREWRRNVLAVLGTVAFVWASTTAIHHRAWEWAGSLETPHGPSRLARKPPVTIRTHGFVTTIVLGDGRAWTTRLSLPPASLGDMVLGNWKVGNALGHSQYLEGANWAAVDRSNTDAVGIQKDGSLWVSEEPDRPQRRSFSSFARAPEPVRMARFGKDNDWKNAAITSLEALMLKTNGTLWRLGTNRFDGRQSWPGLGAFEPIPVAPTLSWSQIFTVGWRIHFREANGAVWGWGPDNFLRTATTKMEIDNGRIIERSPYIAKENWLGLVWVTGRRLPFQVGVRSDGTFRVNTAWSFSSTAHPLRELAPRDFRFGNDSDWVGLAGIESAVVTLKSDGSLWRWRFPENPREPLTATTASRLGSHSDWVAVADSVGGILSLAADGGLYYWPLDESLMIDSPLPFKPLLRRSRKPTLIANLFEQ